MTVTIDTNLYKQFKQVREYPNADTNYGIRWYARHYGLRELAQATDAELDRMRQIEKERGD